MSVPGRIGMLSRRQQTNSNSSTAVADSDDDEEIPETQAVEETFEETTTEITDILEADTEQVTAPVSVQRVDTHKLDSLFSSAKMVEDSLDVTSSDILEADTADISMTSGQSSLLVAETQPMAGAPSDSCSMSLTNSRSNQKIRNKMTDSQILAASTQTLLAKLSDSEVAGDTPGLLTDSLVLAASTQVLGHESPEMNVTTGEGEDSNDSLIFASTQPVFKMPAMPTSSLSDVTAPSSAPSTLDILGAETAPMAEVSGVTEDILGADTAQMEAVPSSSVRYPQDILDEETAQMAVSLTEHEGEEDLPEDQTQADMCFDEIQENIKAAEEFLAASSLPSRPDGALFTTLNQSVNFVNEDSNCSEGLLDGTEEENLLDGVINEGQESQINSTECFSKTSVENITMEVATQPTASVQLGVTSVEDVSMVEASQPPQPISRATTLGKDRTSVNSVTMDQTTAVDSEIISCDNSEIRHLTEEEDLIDGVIKEDQEPEVNTSVCLSKTSVENITMEVATQSTASVKLNVTSDEDASMVEVSQPPQPISRTTTLGRDRTNVNSITMDQTTAVDSEIISCDNSENISPSDVSVPHKVVTSKSKEDPEAEQETVQSPRPVTPVNISNTSRDKSLCLQLDSTLQSPGESPVFKKNSSASQSVDNWSQSRLEDATQFSEDNIDNIDTDVGVKGIHTIKAIRRKSSISSNQNSSFSRSEISKSPEPVNPTPPESNIEECNSRDSGDSGPMLPCTNELVADVESSSDDDEEDLPCSPLKRSQEAKSDIDLDGVLNVIASAVNTAKGFTSDSAPDPSPDVEPVVPQHPQLEETKSAPELEADTDPNNSGQCSKEGQKGTKISGKIKQTSSKLKLKKPSVAPSRPSETVPSSASLKSDRRKKLSLPMGILDSPATISSPRAVPSPLKVAPPQPQLIKELSKTSRKTRAKKEISDDWIVNKKPKSRESNKTQKLVGVDLSVTAADLSKTKSKILEADPSPAPASPGANVSVTAAEVIKARRMRSAQKNETTSEQIGEPAPTLPGRKSRGREKESDNGTVVSKTNESSTSSKTNKTGGIMRETSGGTDLTLKETYIPEVNSTSSTRNRVSFEGVEDESTGYGQIDVEPEPTKASRRKVVLSLRGKKSSEASILGNSNLKQDDDSGEPVVKKGRGKSKKSEAANSKTQEALTSTEEVGKDTSKEGSEEGLNKIRGRAKKAHTSERNTSRASITVAEKVDDKPAAIFRKGRGTPKKSGSLERTMSVPDKDNTAKNTSERNLAGSPKTCAAKVDDLPAAIVKKGRGRPKKSDSLERTTSVSVEANTAKSTSDRNTASPSNKSAEKVDDMPVAIVKKRKGRPKKSDSLESTTSVPEEESTAKESEKIVDNAKKSGRNRLRMSEIPKVKTPEEDSKTTRGRRRKTEPVSKPSEEPVTADGVKKDTSRRSRRISITKEDSVSSVSTLPAIEEKSKTSQAKRGRKRKAECTPERSSSSSKKKAGESSGSGSGGSVRSRSGHSVSSEACSSPSLRKVESLNRNKFSVMFTGYNEHGDVTTVKQLQGDVTESVADCTVLVTDKIRRTAKFLSMVAKGVPIVSPAWITASKKHARFLDPWDFILTDPPNEKKWAFKLSNTLEKARTAQLLVGEYLEQLKNVIWVMSCHVFYPMAL